MTPPRLTTVNRVLTTCAIRAAEANVVPLAISPAASNGVRQASERSAVVISGSAPTSTVTVARANLAIARSARERPAFSIHLHQADADVLDHGPVHLPHLHGGDRRDRGEVEDRERPGAASRRPSSSSCGRLGRRHHRQQRPKRLVGGNAPRVDNYSVDWGRGGSNGALRPYLDGAVRSC